MILGMTSIKSMAPDSVRVSALVLALTKEILVFLFEDYILDKGVTELF